MKFNISGDPKTTSFEERIFNISTFLAATTNILGLCINFLNDFPILINIISAVCIVVECSFYYLGRFKKMMPVLKIPFFVITMLTLCVVWVYNEGVTGSVIVYFCYGLVIFPFIFRHKSALISFLIIISLLIMIVLQYIYPNFVVPYSSYQMRFSDIALTNILLLTMISITLIHFNKSLDNERKRVELQKIKIQNQFNKMAMLHQSIQEQKEKIETQRDEIIQQNELIQKKNRNFMDSVHYAKLIQTAVLPTPEFLNMLLPHHFILFQPRDIVSGDFYFIKQIRQYTLVAAADCTGHGVPGAFMSMLGVALLNEIVRNIELKNSAQVLNELRNQIKEALQQTGRRGEQQDGMDIAFCILNIETLELSFAGANNPCWIFRNNEDCISLAADRQPVGVYAKERNFTPHHFQLQKNDSFYIFTDGYHSQFGGDNEEKFKAKQLKQVLAKIQAYTMTQQKYFLEQTFTQWKGNLEQIDDVLIIGVKI